jgi:NAD(P)-dependent dehydrogenase (short-subunit alcohol dehydrogenase family)
MMLQDRVVLVTGRGSELVSALECGLADAGAQVRRPQHDVTGRMDVLINVVECARSTPFLDMPDQGLNDLLSETLDPAFRRTREVVRSMSLAGVPGTVINIVCQTGHPGHPAPDHRFATHMTQGAMVAFTKALAAELADRDIRVNAIVGRPAAGSEEPLARPFEQVVQAAVFLCTAEGALITGQTLELGGRPLGYEPGGFPA